MRHDYKNNLRLEGVVVANATVHLYKDKEYVHFDLAVRRPSLGSQGNFLPAKDIFPIIAELKRHLHAKLLRKGEWIAVDGALGLYQVSVHQNQSAMHIKADRLSVLREKYYDNKVRLEGLVLKEPIRKMVGRENVLTFELGVRARDKVDLQTGESTSTIDKFPIVVDPYLPPDQHIEQNKMIAVEGMVWAEPMTIEGIGYSHITTRILRLRALGPLLANRTRDLISSELAHLI